MFSWRFSVCLIPALIRGTLIIIIYFFSKQISVCIWSQTNFQQHRCPNRQILFKTRYNAEKVLALGHQQIGISRSVLCLLLNLSRGFFFSPPSNCGKENTVCHHISVCQHLFALWFKCVQWEGNRAVPFTAGDTFCCVWFLDG